MNQKIKNYQLFFEDQIREEEQKQLEKAQTPINQLVQKRELAVGVVDHIAKEKGHLILRFKKNTGPRLKMQKSMAIIKKTAFDYLGSDASLWTCKFVDFHNDFEYHFDFTSLLPIYYLQRNDEDYDYVGCTSIDFDTFNFIEDCLSASKTPRVLLADPLPPTDYYKNLISYLQMHPEDEELMIEPKLSYQDWHPEELAYDDSAPNAIAETIERELEKNDICILQGPPGTGKSYTIAQIVAKALDNNKTVCVTTMANKGLVELAQQKPLTKYLSEGRISKTNLTTEEANLVKGLRPSAKGMTVGRGMMLCATNYMLSYAFSPSSIGKYGLPTYDLLIIEEASQAFLTTIVAFKSLGNKCLIVGDPMQLPPIVQNSSNPNYSRWNVGTQTDGLKTFALGTDTKAFRITTTWRLTPASALLTGMFYDNRFTSVQRETLDFSKIQSELFPSEGGVLYLNTNDFNSKVYSKTALNIISKVVETMLSNYPKTKLAIISPFVDTVSMLQKRYANEKYAKHITVETIDRIQGMTVDYTILYFPGRNPKFALNERRFNVATSRSLSTTLILTDISLLNIPMLPQKVINYLHQCKQLAVDKFIKATSVSEKETIKFFYPGLEWLVDLLLDHNIEFSHEGDVDLMDKNDVVLASAGMILRKQMIAIDPVDETSKAVFAAAGYKIMRSSTFNINELK